MQGYDFNTISLQMNLILYIFVYSTLPFFQISEVHTTMQTTEHLKPAQFVHWARFESVLFALQVERSNKSTTAPHVITTMRLIQFLWMNELTHAYRPHRRLIIAQRTLAVFTSLTIAFSDA